MLNELTCRCPACAERDEKRRQAYEAKVAAAEQSLLDAATIYARGSRSGTVGSLRGVTDAAHEFADVKYSKQ